MIDIMIIDINEYACRDNIKIYVPLWNALKNSIQRYSSREKLYHAA